jgi:hypothetical protein
VQREKVARPALMRSVSVGVNSRAPLRISTLFWSFMFSPFMFRSINWPKTFKEFAPRSTVMLAPVQQPCPHSPIEASPSLLGQVVEGMVHKVVVPIPPPTRAISSALNDRAPLRINTLF